MYVARDKVKLFVLKHSKVYDHQQWQLTSAWGVCNHEVILT